MLLDKKKEKREESRKEKKGFCSFATGRKGEMGKKEKVGRKGGGIRERGKEEEEVALFCAWEKKKREKKSFL